MARQKNEPKDRNEKTRKSLKVKKAVREHKEKKEKDRRMFVKLVNELIPAQKKGEYYIARSNMLAEQIETGEVEETVDGKKKTKEYLIAEYRMTKISAVQCMRMAAFHRQDILNLGYTDEDIKEAYIEYFDKPAARFDKKGNLDATKYDEKFRRSSPVPEFVQEDE